MALQWCLPGENTCTAVLLWYLARCVPTQNRIRALKPSLTFSQMVLSIRSINFRITGADENKNHCYPLLLRYTRERPQHTVQNPIFPQKRVRVCTRRAAFRKSTTAPTPDIGSAKRARAYIGDADSTAVVLVLLLPRRQVKGRGSYSPPRQQLWLWS